MVYALKRSVFLVRLHFSMIPSGFLHHDIVVKDEGKKNFQVAPMALADHMGAGCNLPHPSLFPSLMQGNRGSDFKPGKISPLWSVDMMVSWLVSSEMSCVFQEKAKQESGF